MRNFLKKIILFNSLLAFSFYLLAFINYALYNSEKVSEIQKTSNILLLGDSTMECAINDTIFEHSFNKAHSSDSYFYSYLKLKDFIKSDQNIDTVFISFSPHNVFDNGWLQGEKNIYSRFRQYYFLMDWEDFSFLFSKNSAAVISSIPSIARESIKNTGKRLRGQSISSIYGGFNKLDRNILEEVKLKLKNGEKLPFFDIPTNFSISENEITYLNKIIKLTKKNGIQLYLVNLPKRSELLEYPKYGTEDFYQFYDLNYSNIDFLDFSRLEMLDDYYGDFVHLNSKGSTYFSTMLQNSSITTLENKFKRKAINHK